MFSAVNFGRKRFPALVNPFPNPSRMCLVTLNLLKFGFSGFKRLSGDGRWGDENVTGVGDRAKVLGGEDDSKVTVCIAGTAPSHWLEQRSGNLR